MGYCVGLCHALEKVPILIVKSCMLGAEMPDLVWIIPAFGRTIGGFGCTSVMLTHLHVGLDGVRGWLSHPYIHKLRAVGE